MVSAAIPESHFTVSILDLDFLYMNLITIGGFNIGVEFFAHNVQNYGRFSTTWRTYHNYFELFPFNFLFLMNFTHYLCLIIKNYHISLFLSQ